ncbi:hypothetical protein [uncultured Virgibacillus sp.]|uniref:hypothetical protein n=1 Tax=uncultured Virgibacillus sp. TaxID=417355 RepID=UPI00196523DF|nr:hypothetical protein [uncultured Virgibacillus sp.]QRZ19750.1 hypothetical protein JUJ52_08980 [Virgibacillus sp. AGTR]
MFVPQGDDLKVFEAIGHLLAVDPTLSILISLYSLKWGLTASYINYMGNKLSNLRAYISHTESKLIP